jgi:hypothetical protein
MSAESIQEAFLFLNIEDVNKLPQEQQWALCIHAFNLYKGFKLTGFMEDDPRAEVKESNIESIVQLPADWSTTNADVVSFRYEHENNPNYECFFKIIKTKWYEIEINCYQSLKADAEGSNDLAKLMNFEFKMEALQPEKFNNLDDWLKRHASIIAYE